MDREVFKICQLLTIVLLLRLCQVDYVSLYVHSDSEQRMFLIPRLQ